MPGEHSGTCARCMGNPLTGMQAQLEQGTYPTPEAFFNQLHLIFLNACFCQSHT